MQHRTLLSRHALSLGLALAVTGCSFHAHSEFHAGTGGDNSEGGEQQAAEPTHHHHAHSGSEHEGHKSSAGRDDVVRVSREGKPSSEQGGGSEEPARTAVHPTGDVPPRSSAGGDGAAAGAAGAGAAGADGSSGSASAAGGGGNAIENETPKPPESTPAGDAPADEASSGTNKGTRKSPSEPHVTAPTHTKPRKVNRSSSSSSSKGESHQ